MIDHFISISISSTFAILLRLVFSCFVLGLMVLFCIAIRRDSIIITIIIFIINFKSYNCIEIICIK